MIAEFSEEVWKNMTKETKDRILSRPNIKVSLFRTTMGKGGLKKISHIINAGD